MSSADAGKINFVRNISVLPRLSHAALLGYLQLLADSNVCWISAFWTHATRHSTYSASVQTLIGNVYLDLFVVSTSSALIARATWTRTGSLCAWIFSFAQRFTRPAAAPRKTAVLEKCASRTVALCLLVNLLVTSSALSPSFKKSRR